MVRLLSGLVLAVAALAAILWLPSPALRVLAVLVALLASYEYAGLARGGGHAPSVPVTAVLVGVTCWLVSFPGQRADVILVAALAVLLVEVLLRGRSLAEASTTVTAGLYVGVPLGLLAALHQRDGREAVLLLIGAVVVSDSAQYYTGRLFGRHPLAPTISPKKTIEGAVGGVLGGVLFLVVAGSYALPSARPWALGVMGVALAVLGICGDLFESRLKRAVGVKDSGAVIPGHGGVLDRLDALLFATPAFYVFLHQLM